VEGEEEEEGEEVEEGEGGPRARSNGGLI